jgi:chorismate mutase
VDRFNKSLSMLNGGMSEGDAALAWEQAGRHRRTMVPESLNRPRKHDLRSMVDRYDKQILSALGHRIDIVRKIGKIKLNQATPVVDPDRERRMMVEREEWGKSLGLPQDLVAELFAVIMKHSSRIQAEKL